MSIQWPGNTRNWAPEVWKIVRELESRFDVHCYTYADHGRPGERWSIDVPVAPLGQRANASQEALGDKVQELAEEAWRRWGLDYVIWWNWMKESKESEWFSYEPYAFKWPYGSNDPETRRHLDHFHLSTHPSFTYRPPPKAEGERDMNFDARVLLDVYTNPQIANVPDIDSWEAKAYAPHLKAAFLKHGFRSRRQVAHWMAHAGYESGCLNWLEEFDGRNQARRYGYSGGPRYYGRGPAMLTHDYNYRDVGNLMGVNLVERPGRIGTKYSDPVEWPRNNKLCMESGVAFVKVRDMLPLMSGGDEAFDEVMRRWLGTANHPSYRDRFALYRAAITKLPRPLFFRN